MEKFLNRILRYPKILLVIILAITAVFFVVMKKNSRMETDLDKYMPEKHPAFVFSNQAEEWFDIKDAIIIAIENKNGIYNYETLKKIKDITKKLQKMKEIEKNDVTSLFTADNIVGTEEGMDVKAFYKKVPESEENLKEIQEKVRENNMVFGRLVSDDETVSIIIAEIGDNVFTQDFYHKIIKLSKEFEGPEKLFVAGRPIIEGTMAYLGPKDMKKMVPIVVLVILIVLFAVLRSLKATLFTFLVVIFSTIWAFGLMALIKIPIYAVSTMIPVMLIAIGVADGIHIYNHLHLFLKENPNASKKEAVKDLIKGMWKPVVMTSVTTAVGFISLLTSQVYPIKYFGLFTAFGVMVAMLFSLVLIPSAIIAFGLPRWKKSAKTSDDSLGNDKFSKIAAQKILQYKGLVVALTIIVVIISIYGVSKVWINSSFLDKFEKNSDIVKTDEFINEHFGGTSTLNVILISDKKGTFKNPAVLKLIDKMQAETENSLPEVGNSFSLADYLKRMNKVMHADDEQFDTIPDSRNLIAQYLLLYEMSGNPDNLWKVVDYNYQKANVVFQLKKDNSKTIKNSIAVIEKYKMPFEKFGVEIKYAGSGYKSLVFTNLILKGQIMSLVMSLFIIFILLSLMFKKISVGFIGSVPIVITALIGFGIMGLFNIPLSTTTALLSSVAIGIGIDYAVHFIERYKIYAEQTKNKKLTAELTIHHSGRAIIFNAFVVIAGFMVLLFSVFPPNRALGALVSLNMFTSFLGTVTIMYIILYKSNIFFKKKKISNEQN